MAIQRLAISWQLSDTHGWGVFGLNLARMLLRHGPIRPQILTEPNLGSLTAAEADELRPLVDEMRQLRAAIEARGQSVRSDQIAVLHALGANFQHVEVSDLVRGGANVGFTFFERGGFDADAVGRANAYDRILAGSSWNRDYARAAGVANVDFVAQGIDPDLFHPGPPSAAYGGRFAVFSGGKLELRKGQDLVLAAFKIFHARHPDSVLVTSWRNAWPDSAMDITASVHVTAAPETDAAGDLRITDWAVANGVPADAVVDLGWLPNKQMPDVLRDMHVGLFPNRCEGGTNLVAMEAMATGLPCILSANTGHLDIITADNCFALTDQRPVTDEHGPTGMWRESQVEEIVAALETAYADRDAAAARGDAGARFMQGMTWRRQTEKLVAAIADLLR